MVSFVHSGGNLLLYLRVDTGRNNCGAHSGSNFVHPHYRKLDLHRAVHSFLLPFNPLRKEASSWATIGRNGRRNHETSRPRSPRSHPPQNLSKECLGWRKLRFKFQSEVRICFWSSAQCRQHPMTYLRLHTSLAMTITPVWRVSSIGRL